MQKWGEKGRRCTCQEVLQLHWISSHASSTDLISPLEYILGKLARGRFRPSPEERTFTLFREKLYRGDESWNLVTKSAKFHYAPLWNVQHPKDMIRRPSKGTRDVSGYTFDTISKVDQSYTSRFFTRVLPSVHEDKREMIFVFLWIVARYLVSGSLTLYSRISFHDFYWKKFSSIWLNERLHECNFLLSFNSSSVSFFSSFSSTFSATTFLSYIILYYYNTRNVIVFKNYLTR